MRYISCGKGCCGVAGLLRMRRLRAFGLEQGMDPQTLFVRTCPNRDVIIVNYLMQSTIVPLLYLLFMDLHSLFLLCLSLFTPP